MSETKTITVHSTAPGGHYRAGRKIEPTGTTVPLAELSVAQLRQLADDPRIVTPEGFASAEAEAAKAEAEAAKAEADATKGKGKGK